MVSICSIHYEASDPRGDAGGQGGGELNKVPRYNPLHLYITFLTEKGPFSYTFY